MHCITVKKVTGVLVFTLIIAIALLKHYQMQQALQLLFSFIFNADSTILNDSVIIFIIA